MFGSRSKTLGTAVKCQVCGENYDPRTIDASGRCLQCAEDLATAQGRGLEQQRQSASAAELSNWIKRIESGDFVWSEVPENIIDHLAIPIVVTSGLEVPGRSIIEAIDVISAESALGMNMFRDIANSWRDAVGGRSRTLQNALRENRKNCLLELRREALMIGADAIIGIDLDYAEFSSTAVSGGMIMTVATGTAVRTVPVS